MGPIGTTGPQAPKGDREPDDTTSPTAGHDGGGEGAPVATQVALTDTSAEDLGLTLARAPSSAVPEGRGADPLIVLLNQP